MQFFFWAEFFQFFSVSFRFVFQDPTLGRHSHRRGPDFAREALLATDHRALCVQTWALASLGWVVAWQGEEAQGEPCSPQHVVVFCFVLALFFLLR